MIIPQKLSRKEKIKKAEELLIRNLRNNLPYMDVSEKPMVWIPVLAGIIGFIVGGVLVVLFWPYMQQLPLSFPRAIRRAPFTIFDIVFVTTIVGIFIGIILGFIKKRQNSGR